MSPARLALEAARNGMKAAMNGGARAANAAAPVSPPVAADAMPVAAPVPIAAAPAVQPVAPKPESPPPAASARNDAPPADAPPPWMVDESSAEPPPYDFPDGAEARGGAGNADANVAPKPAAVASPPARPTAPTTPFKAEPVPLLNWDGDWPALETAAEAWFIRATWEMDRTLDAAPSLVNLNRFADQALRIWPGAPSSNVLKGLAYALELRRDPARRALLLPAAQARLKAAQGGHIPERLGPRLKRELSSRS